VRTRAQSFSRLGIVVRPQGLPWRRPDRRDDPAASRPE